MKSTTLPGILRAMSIRSGLAATLTMVCAATLLTGVVGPPGAAAATPTVPLGAAGSFAALAGSTITNTGSTVVNGDLGLSPGTAVTGFPPGVVNGAVHTATAVALQAKNDLTTAYDDAAARTTTATVPVELGGTTKAPGVHDSPAGTFGITGTVTLDAMGDPNAVFIFKAASTLITASASSVTLTGGAKACNVFWVVGSSATLGTYSTLRGTVMAMASITATTGVTVDGRLLARTAAVTLDTNTVTRPSCTQATVATTTTLRSSANPAPAGTPVGFTATVTADTGTAVPTGVVVFMDGNAVLGSVPLNSVGRGVLTTSALTAGTHRIRAVYAGATGFTGSSSARLTQSIV